MDRRIVAIVALLVGLGCGVGCQSTNGKTEATSDAPTTSSESSTASTGGAGDEGGDRRADPKEPVQPELEEGRAAATFAGGCFWCMEKPFEKREGVVSVVSGFCGGESEDPSYKEVAGGETAHTETVRIVYDPDEISYETLLKIYWRQIDPTDDGGQFVDRGSQYRPAIFYHDDRQKRLAEESKERLAESGRFDEPIVVDIVPASKFWAANDYHQDYYKTHPDRYERYRRGSGRDEFLREHWGEERKVE